MKVPTDWQTARLHSSRAEWLYTDTLAEVLGDRLQCLSSDQSQRLDLPAQIVAPHPHGQLLLCGCVSRVCPDAADGDEAVLVLDSDFRPDPGE